MAEFKVVIGSKDGKSYQKDIKGAEADALMKKRIGETISGNELGLAGYEFQVTGGSDIAGFPLRKGITTQRKRIMTGKGVGFSGLNRWKQKQPGLVKRRTVAGEMVTSSVRQVNLKVITAGSEPLAPAEAKKE